MPVDGKHGALLRLEVTPIRDCLQRWRLTLASLLFYILLLVDNFGLSNHSQSKNTTFNPLLQTTEHLGNSYPALNLDNSLNKCNRGIPNIGYSDLNINSTYNYFRTPWFPQEILLNITQSDPQCLPLKNRTLTEICSIRSNNILKRRTLELRNLYFQFCDDYSVFKVIDNQSQEYCNMTELENNSTKCAQCMEYVELLDTTAQSLYNAFLCILERYDCRSDEDNLPSHTRSHTHSYTVSWNCTECKVAYKSWLCAMTIPYYLQGRLVRPCMNFCRSVEQRCPYLHPVKDEEFAGEPSFMCSADIPTTDIPPQEMVYGECPDCYQQCHLYDDKCAPIRFNTSVSNESRVSNDTDLQKYDCPTSMASSLLWRDRTSFLEAKNIVNVVLILVHLLICYVCQLNT